MRLYILHSLVLLLLFLLVRLPVESRSARILGLFPHYGYSHFKVFHPILHALAERGHHVTVITFIKSDANHSNYEEWLLTGQNTKDWFALHQFPANRDLITLWHEFFALHNEGKNSCHHFYRSGLVNKILDRHGNNPFDLVLTEFFNTDCYLGVPYILQVPIVGLSSCALMPWFYDRIALPDFPSYVQSEFVGFPQELNIIDRTINFIQANGNKLLYRMFTSVSDSEIIHKYLGIQIDVEKFARESTSLIMVNQHYTVFGNRPSTPQLIEIGGIHIEDNELKKPLPQEIVHFLEEVPGDEVLFISFGSMLRAASIDQTRLENILANLKQFPWKIIWKWESDNIPTYSDQFLFVKWAPQLALLCHPKVKYFWGHGGLLGTTETVYCGKPALLTPIYGDQFLNAHAMQNRGVARLLPYEFLNHNNLNLWFKEIQQLKYTIRALQLSYLFRSRQINPLENAVWWIEHLLTSDRIALETLRTHAVHLDTIVYYSIDSILIISLVVFICFISASYFFSITTNILYYIFIPILFIIKIVIAMVYYIFFYE